MGQPSKQLGDLYLVDNEEKGISIIDATNKKCVVWFDDAATRLIETWIVNRNQKNAVVKKGKPHA